MNRVKNFDATGNPPNGRLYPDDLNEIQDAAAAQADLAQTIDLSTLRIGETGLTLSRYGAGEAVISGMFRATALLRALAGIVAGTFTTAQRDAIAAGRAPTGIIIWNSTVSALQINVGSDASRNWQTIATGALGPWGTGDIQDGAITSAKIANGTIAAADIAAGVIPQYLRKTSSLIVVSSVAETDLFNGELVIPAGAIGASGTVEITASGDYINNDNYIVSPRFKLKLGSNVLLDTSADVNQLRIGPANTRFAWQMKALIQNLGSASSQSVRMEIDMALTTVNIVGNRYVPFATGEGKVETSGDPGYYPGLHALGWNTTGVNTALQQALSFSVILGSAASTHEIKLAHALAKIF